MPFESSGGLCSGCLQRPFPFASAQAALAYGGPLIQALLRFKHGGHRHLAASLARRLGPAMVSLWQQADLVCPVPLHRDRLKSRGYNQALELVRAVGRRLPAQQQSKVACDLLSRNIDTPALGHGSPAARARAVAGAFTIRKTDTVVEKHILVVDDVMTSGATLAECARTLLTGGAAKVSVAALARAI
jgi:ComF family protein